MARFEERQVALRVEFGDEAVAGVAIADRPRRRRDGEAHRLEDAKVVPFQEIARCGERTRIFPQLAERRLQGSLELARRMVEVDGREHHVTRQHERFERDDPAAVDAEDGFPEALEHAQGRDELIRVVAPVHHTREVAVAEQVVHAVGIEIRAAHELPQHGVRGERVADDEGEHLFRIHADRIEERFDLRQRQDLFGPLLVPDSENRLAGVTERSVAHVVQQ
jgi:hypothetical protein